MKTADFSAWEAFRSVARHGSFSKAAKQLHVGVPQLSKRVNRLEGELGVRLFSRSTRVVKLTDEGMSLLPKVDAVLEDFESLESTFLSEKTLSGTIRITAVPFVAHRLLMPVLKEFSARHPDVKFELELTENFSHLVESRFDLALRIHENPRDSNLVYRRLAPNPLIFVASPEYLKPHKAPKDPADLKDHATLMLDVHARCKFQDKNARLGDVVQRSPFRSESGWFLTELALAGAGILVRSRWDVQDYLKEGRLVEVLKNTPLESFGQIYAVVPARKFLAPRVRALLESLSQAV